MNNLTSKQLKTRWIDIKKQISSRQLLAYRVGIPLEKWDEYMLSVPNEQEINRIYLAIQDDRKAKTLRVKEGLSKIVGYREAKDFSKKIGVSDTSIRGILEGKKEIAGYDLINKMELFLNVATQDFEISLENPLSIDKYTQDHFIEIATEINKIADSLKLYCFELIKISKNKEENIDWKGEKIKPSRSLDISIGNLTLLKNNIDVFWEYYVDPTLRKAK